MNIKFLIIIFYIVVFSGQKNIINKQKKIVNIAFGINNNCINLLIIAL